MYKSKWNKKLGFFRYGKGCILPHRKRSEVCLCYHCNYGSDFSNKMEDIRDVIFRLERIVTDRVRKERI